MKRHYWQYLIDSAGNSIADASIKVFLSGTNTYAYIQTSESAETYLSSEYVDLVTDEKGFFEFWISDLVESPTYGYGITQKFRIAFSKAGYVSDYIDNVQIIWGGTDGKVKLDVNDPLGYLAEKIVGGHNLSVTPSAGQLIVSFVGIDEDYKVKVSGATQGDYLGNLLIPGNNIAISPSGDQLQIAFEGIADTYKVKINAQDTEDYLTNKLTGGNHISVTPSGSALQIDFVGVADTYKVKLNAGATEEYLQDALLAGDHISLTPSGNQMQIDFVGITDTYKVKTNVSATENYLQNVLLAGDHISVTPSGSEMIIAYTGIIPTSEYLVTVFEAGDHISITPSGGALRIDFVGITDTYKVKLNAGTTEQYLANALMAGNLISLTPSGDAMKFDYIGYEPSEITYNTTSMVVSAGGTGAFTFTNFINRGLCHYIKVWETGGVVTGSYNITLYNSSSMTEAVSAWNYKATSVDPRSTLEDYQPFFVADRDGDNKLFVKIVNNDLVNQGTWYAQLICEKFA